MSVCFKLHLISGASDNTATYSADNEGQYICGVFSETAPLQRSSTPSVVRTYVGHFPADSAHAHYMHVVAPRVYAHECT